MKAIINSLISILIVLIYTTSCNYPGGFEDLNIKTNPPVVSFKNIKIKARLSGIESSLISEKGFCMNKVDNYSDKLLNFENSKTRITVDGKEFEAVIPLEESRWTPSEYKICSYIITNNLVIYGNTINFETLPNLNAIPKFTKITGIVAATLYDATFSATVYQDEYPITEKGLCWGNKNYLDTTNNKINAGSGNGEYTIVIKNTTPDIKYRARFYAVNEAGIEYTDVFEFTNYSKDYIPVVTSNPTATNITFKSATLGGNISSDKDYPITERGFCWSTKTVPTVDDNKITASNDVSTSFSATLNELQASTTYYCRAYAINEAGVGYGNTINFRTTANTIRLSTMIATDITNSTATIGGEVISEGDAPVTEKGVCWGFVTTPDKTDHFAITGTGAGSFTKTLTGLQSGARYYYRSYAINKYGIVYGEIKSFIVK